WSPEAMREAQRAASEESRLGIPLIIGFDVVHGHRTVFPIPLGEAASFDPALWQETAAAAAKEAAADGISLTFAPMLDVARDPRWGRICEGPGEDPYVGQVFAVAKVKGFQGRSLDDPARLAATAKHIGAYGATLAGRDYASADLSESDMAEVQLPAFASAVAAGVAAIMPSFNDIAGLPSTANAALLTGLLRQRWGFDGIIVSDYNAVAELIVHGVAADHAEAAALALRAGVDIDMMGGSYSRGLAEALVRGLVTLPEIDAAVLRVLRLKERLGLFADPYRGIGPDAEPARVAHRGLARRAAAAAMVLLKNEAKALPLSSTGGAIAVIGPLAQAADDMLGPWSGAGRAEDCVTLLDGIRAAFPGRTILYEPASGFDSAKATMALAREAEAIVFCGGETRRMSGEANSRGEPDLALAQRRLATKLIATGKPVIAIICCGRPIVLPPVLVDKAAAILVAWFGGSEAGTALGDVLNGHSEPGGRLPVTWPAAIGQIPIYYARRRSGRPADARQHYTSKYLDIPVEPQFAFGHGLGYAPLRFANAQVDRATIGPGQSLTVSVDVVNDGNREGATVAMLYVQDPVASLARPIMLLKRFEKISVAPGAVATVHFTLTTDVFAFLGIDMERIVESGRIDLLIGGRAVEEELLRLTIEVTGGRSHIAAASVRAAVNR
ncbi:MAG: glycoside hydrolase family 3 C-terminal domain-containing protein, partial [Rhizobiales bacterium]|nr:glycoside hydrolase family 3 C-terminal domain-containing protein [Hyphomicrobiales bacterium]